MEHLAPRLAAIPGVVAVTLGGSRSTHTAVDGSDWDFGLYYQGGSTRPTSPPSSATSGPPST